METYGVLSPDLPNYGRIPAIKMPIANCDPGMRVGSCDAGNLPVTSYDAVLPAINLPGLCEVLPQAMPCVSELPCSCQAPLAYQFVETCGCRTQSPIVELPSTMLKIPTASCIQAPKCLPQVIQLPPCGCQTMPRGCQNIPCGYQNIPCGVNIPCNSCQNLPCGCQSMPCSCQSMSCSCQNIPCSCQTMPCGCPNIPCSCQNMPCSCQNCNYKCQNTYVPQLPLELPCACQACQSSPLEIPVYGCGCQSLPPPVIGCGGKYLRQVTIQPPFL